MIEGVESGRQLFVNRGFLIEESWRGFALGRSESKITAELLAGFHLLPTQETQDNVRAAWKHGASFISRDGAVKVTLPFKGFGLASSQDFDIGVSN